MTSRYSTIRAAGLATIAALGLAACATPQTREMDKFLGDIPSSSNQEADRFLNKGGSELTDSLYSVPIAPGSPLPFRSRTISVHKDTLYGGEITLYSGELREPTDTTTSSKGISLIIEDGYGSPRNSGEITLPAGTVKTAPGIKLTIHDSYGSPQPTEEH